MLWVIGGDLIDLRHAAAVLSIYAVMSAPQLPRRQR